MKKIKINSKKRTKRLLKVLSRRRKKKISKKIKKRLSARRSIKKSKKQRKIKSKKKSRVSSKRRSKRRSGRKSRRNIKINKTSRRHRKKIQKGGVIHTLIPKLTTTLDILRKKDIISYGNTEQIRICLHFIPKLKQLYDHSLKMEKKIAWEDQAKVDELGIDDTVIEGLERIKGGSSIDLEDELVDAALEPAITGGADDTDSDAESSEDGDIVDGDAAASGIPVDSAAVAATKEEPLETQMAKLIAAQTEKEETKGNQSYGRRFIGAVASLGSAPPTSLAETATGLINLSEDQDVQSRNAAREMFKHRRMSEMSFNRYKIYYIWMNTFMKQVMNKKSYEILKTLRVSMEINPWMLHTNLNFGITEFIAEQMQVACESTGLKVGYTISNQIPDELYNVIIRAIEQSKSLKPLFDLDDNTQVSLQTFVENINKMALPELDLIIAQKNKVAMAMIEKLFKGAAYWYKVERCYGLKLTFKEWYNKDYSDWHRFPLPDKINSKIFSGFLKDATGSVPPPAPWDDLDSKALVTLKTLGSPSEMREAYLKTARHFAQKKEFTEIKKKIKELESEVDQGIYNIVLFRMNYINDKYFDPQSSLNELREEGKKKSAEKTVALYKAAAAKTTFRRSKPDFDKNITSDVTYNRIFKHLLKIMIDEVLRSQKWILANPKVRPKLPSVSLAFEVLGEDDEDLDGAAASSTNTMASEIFGAIFNILDPEWKSIPIWINTDENVWSIISKISQIIYQNLHLTQWPKKKATIQKKLRQAAVKLLNPESGITDSGDSTVSLAVDQLKMISGLHISKGAEDELKSNPHLLLDTVRDIAMSEYALYRNSMSTITSEEIEPLITGNPILRRHYDYENRTKKKGIQSINTAFARMQAKIIDSVRLTGEALKNFVPTLQKNIKKEIDARIELWTDIDKEIDKVLNRQCIESDTTQNALLDLYNQLIVLTVGVHKKTINGETVFEAKLIQSMSQIMRIQIEEFSKKMEWGVYNEELSSFNRGGIDFIEACQGMEDLSIFLSSGLGGDNLMRGCVKNIFDLTFYVDTGELKKLFIIIKDLDELTGSKSIPIMSKQADPSITDSNSVMDLARICCEINLIKTYKTSAKRIIQAQQQLVRKHIVSYEKTKQDTKNKIIGRFASFGRAIIMIIFISLVGYMVYVSCDAIYDHYKAPFVLTEEDVKNFVADIPFRPLQLIIGFCGKIIAFFAQIGDTVWMFTRIACTFIFLCIELLCTYLGFQLAQKITNGIEAGTNTIVGGVLDILDKDARSQYSPEMMKYFKEQTKALDDAREPSCCAGCFGCFRGSAGKLAATAIAASSGGAAPAAAAALSALSGLMEYGKATSDYIRQQAAEHAAAQKKRDEDDQQWASEGQKAEMKAMNDYLGTIEFNGASILLALQQRNQLLQQACGIVKLLFDANEEQKKKTAITQFAAAQSGHVVSEERKKVLSFGDTMQRIREVARDVKSLSAAANKLKQARAIARDGALSVESRHQADFYTSIGSAAQQMIEMADKVAANTKERESEREKENTAAILSDIEQKKKLDVENKYKSDLTHLISLLDDFTHGPPNLIHKCDYLDQFENIFKIEFSTSSDASFTDINKVIHANADKKGKAQRERHKNRINYFKKKLRGDQKVLNRLNILQLKEILYELISANVQFHSSEDLILLYAEVDKIVGRIEFKKYIDLYVQYIYTTRVVADSKSASKTSDDQGPVEVVAAEPAAGAAATKVEVEPAAAAAAATKVEAEPAAGAAATKVEVESDFMVENVKKSPYTRDEFRKEIKMIKKIGRVKNNIVLKAIGFSNDPSTPVSKIKDFMDSWLFIKGKIPGVNQDDSSSKQISDLVGTVRGKDAINILIQKITELEIATVYGLDPEHKKKNLEWLRKIFPQSGGSHLQDLPVEEQQLTVNQEEVDEMRHFMLGQIQQYERIFNNLNMINIRMAIPDYFQDFLYSFDIVLNQTELLMKSEHFDKLLHIMITHKNKILLEDSEGVRMIHDTLKPIITQKTNNLMLGDDY